MAFVSGVNRPRDIGDSWSGVLGGLAEIPLDLQISPAPMPSIEEVQVFQAACRNLDRGRVSL